jgi:tetratricopeptide (TPR) repeat protein
MMVPSGIRTAGVEQTTPLHAIEPALAHEKDAGLTTKSVSFIMVGQIMKNIFFTLRSPLAHLLILTALALAVYSGSFSVPFHFDDKLNIVDNPRIKDIANFWPPTGMRWFGYLTVGLNYQVNGLDPYGYHAVNLAVHILTAFLAYWLILLTSRTPYWTASGRGQEVRWPLIALMTALIFVSHPVQTQAVTYLVQRFASLAALLYLLSLTLYVKARLLPFEGKDKPAALQALLYALALAAALLALLTKENAVTLPAVIVLYELCFFPEPGRRRSIVKTIILLAPVLLALLIAFLFMTGDEAVASLRATTDISRSDYLLTQFPVVATYIRLLLLPLGQSIDYDIPVRSSFFDPAVLLSFAFLVLLLGAAIFLFLRSRTTRGPARLTAFGILWFFITLSVESSIIPLPDVIFEHRLYLPSVGFFIAVLFPVVAGGERLLRDRPRTKRVLASCLVLLICLSAAAAFMRNRVWSSELGLWEDAVAKHPASYRAHTMLGGLYKREGRREDAKRSFLRSLAIRPSYSEARVNLGSIYAEEGRLDEAMREFLIAVETRGMDEIDTGLLFVQIGNVYRLKNMPDREIEYYTYALGMIPSDAFVHALLGRAYQSKGMHQQAREYFQRAHELNPDRY